MDESRRESEQFDSDDESPDEILGEFLEGHSLGDTAAFEELLKRFPKHEDYLRRLAAEIRRAFERGDEAGGPISFPPRLLPLFARLRHADQKDAQRFAAKEEIGRGGMGVVLCIRDHALRRDLAKKSIRNDRRHGERAERSIERFIDEAQITAQLDHPGVVPVHDLGVDADGSPFFTMRRVRGEDLRKIFAKVADGADGWSLPRAVSVLLRVCETMAYSHEKNVIHRDLKPENVMVGRFGEVYVMDWGLARTLGRKDPRDLRVEFAPKPTSHASTDLRDDGAPGEVLITADGQILGTPVYMPPEQAAGDTANLGKAADVYSVGAMLYELLAGHQPYVRPGTTASGRMVLRWILDGPPHALTHVAKHSPPELIAICDRAMARRPDRRYPSIAAFGDDLRAWLEGRVVRAHRSGAWAEFSAWVRRNRVTAATAASLVFVVVVASLLSAWLFREQAAASRNAVAERGLRLDIRDADALIREVDNLWPIDPSVVPRFDHWLARAEDLCARLARYDRPPLIRSDDDFAIDTRTIAEQKKFQNLVDTLKDIDERLAFPDNPPSLLSALHDARPAVLEALDWRRNRQEIDRLRRNVAAADFAADRTPIQDREHEIDRIYARLALLADDGHGLMREVARRRELATGVAQRSIIEYEKDWTNAIAIIADSVRSPQYHGVRIEPQLGLVPLGADPSSGMQEFWHVLSGHRPLRGENGRFKIDGSTGMVFVLIPGGAYQIGSQNSDPDGPLFDESTRTEEFLRNVKLAPFMLSKYEMTLGQWSRVGDSLPSEYHAGYPVEGQPYPTFAHPVESVPWFVVERVLSRWGLDLPSEAQWEVAARSNNSSPSLIDVDDPTTLRTVNFFDPGNGAVRSKYDGFIVHGPVDAFDPNPFGLYCVLGNVAEYCADWFYGRPAEDWVSGSDALVTPPFFDLKSERGGHFQTAADELRFALRDHNNPENGRKTTGVRPRYAMTENRPWNSNSRR